MRKSILILGLITVFLGGCGSAQSAQLEPAKAPAGEVSATCYCPARSDIATAMPFRIYQPTCAELQAAVLARCPSHPASGSACTLQEHTGCPYLYN